MDDKIETRSLTMPRETWQKIDAAAQNCGALNAQEVIRQWIREKLAS